MGATAISIAFLLKLPAVPNCPSIFWPLASASLRLHCAQIAAGKRTAKDLIEAIELVGGLPKDHPLYEEASRWIEEWSRELLDVAQEEAEQVDVVGRLGHQHAAAVAAKQVEERIKQWESIWAEAEAIERKVDEFLSKRQPQNAFNEATKLLSIDNPYWQNQRYAEVGERIATVRGELNKLGEADRAIKDGNVEDLMKALAGLETIPEKSPVYADVKDLKPRIGKRLLALAEDAADRGNFDEAIKIANQIPESVQSRKDTEDFVSLVGAQSKASKGSSIDLEEAISQAGRIPVGRPLHARAQQLIARWQLTVRDIAQLDRAREMARTGSPEGIQSAIAEASAIGSNNPKYQEARDFIDRERKKLTPKAAPIVAASPLTATPVNSPASDPIEPENSDQSFFQDANRLAQSGDLDSAVSLLQQISPSSPLYGQALDRIRTWQAQSQSEQGLQQAFDRAASGQPEDLFDAIAIAQQIPSNSTLRNQANQNINQWSEQILQAASSQAAYDTPGAIAMASRIPSGTSAYAAAQANIAKWRQQIGQ